MIVYLATMDDYQAWLDFTERVLPIFGIELSTDEGYQKALEKNIRRGTAFCIKADDAPDRKIIGGMLLSPTQKPVYQIGWFAVDKDFMHRGIGTTLFKFMMTRIEPPAEVFVDTFTASDPHGISARNFYAKMGMVPAEIIEGDFPHGRQCQIYRKKLEAFEPMV
ncbi:MAG TPA: GNAT family N-acetyltransferase [Bacillota bacterium]